jgi:Matrixin
MTRWSIVAVVLAGCGSMELEPKFNPRPSILPNWATEIEEDVYSLGFDVDPVTGQEIEGVAIIDRVGVEPAEPISPMDMTSKLSCWKSIAGLGGWTTVEDWGFDGTNSSGLADADIQATFEDAIDLWELVITSGTDVLGVYDAGNTLAPSTTSDGENNIAFGDAGGGGIVAVTYLWSSIGGDIIEWDQIYEDTDPWSIGDPVPAAEFDLLNVAAHEMGHAMGLDHPTGGGCTRETMYASVSLGESKKRTLTNGDSNGINKQYP